MTTSNVTAPSVFEKKAHVHFRAGEQSNLLGVAYMIAAYALRPIPKKDAKKTVASWKRHVNDTARNYGINTVGDKLGNRVIADANAWASKAASTQEEPLIKGIVAQLIKEYGKKFPISFYARGETLADRAAAKAAAEAEAAAREEAAETEGETVDVTLPDETADGDAPQTDEDQPDVVDAVHAAFGKVLPGVRPAVVLAMWEDLDDAGKREVATTIALRMHAIDNMPDAPVQEEVRKAG